MALFAVAGVGLFTARPDAALGSPAPGFSLPGLHDPDRDIALDDLRGSPGWPGRPVVVNFWASWCDPCRDEAPELVEVSQAYADRVHFLGVSILDGRDEARAFVAEFGIGYPNVRDGAGAVSRRYRVTGIPETVFIDATGRMVGKYIGAFEPGQLELLVEQLLVIGPDDVLDIVGSGRTQPVP